MEKGIIMIKSADYGKFVKELAAFGKYCIVSNVDPEPIENMHSITKTRVCSAQNLSALMQLFSLQRSFFAFPTISFRFVRRSWALVAPRRTCSLGKLVLLGFYETRTNWTISPAEKQSPWIAVQLLFSTFLLALFFPSMFSSLRFIRVDFFFVVAWSVRAVFFHRPYIHISFPHGFCNAYKYRARVAKSSWRMPHIDSLANTYERAGWRIG